MLHPYKKKKKRNKESLKNYRPISLLPICSKIFERLIYNEMFTFFTENTLISPNQDLDLGTLVLTNYLLLHKIYKSLDEGFEVKWVFLDLSLEDFQFMV